MRAAVLLAPRRFQIEERPRPIPGRGDVVVEICATAVCHSDLDMYRGNHPLHYPAVLGHEATGTVVAIGAEVKRVRPGQNILINPVLTCGQCDCCRRGLDYLCRSSGIIGREVDGSLSEYLCLAARYVHPLPSHVALDQATIIETLSTVKHAQQRAAIARGESVVVLGQGTSGLLHTRLAVLSGATVIAVSRTQWKLDIASRMGAQYLVAASVEAAVDEVLRLTEGEGAEVIIDTVGGADTLSVGIRMLRPGGRFCSYSASSEPFASVSAFQLYHKEITVLGARAMTPADIDESIDLVASGKFDLSDFVTMRYPLTGVAAAFEKYERNPDQVLRIVIDSRATD